MAARYEYPPAADWLRGDSQPRLTLVRAGHGIQSPRPACRDTVDRRRSGGRVTSDLAIVDIDNQIGGVKTMPVDIAVPKDGVIKTQLMEVFARRDGRWWIEAYHNVDLEPIPKS